MNLIPGPARRFTARALALALLATVLLTACTSGSPTASTPVESTIPSAPASEAASFAPPDLAGRIIFTRSGATFGDETVFTANANGTDEHQLTDLGAACCPWATRDGTRIVFSTPAPDGRITTVTVNFDGSDKFVIPLPDGALELGTGPFSPDGHQIAFEGFGGADNALAGIYIGNTDGTNLVKITGRGIPGDWSPDGTRLVFFRGPDGEPPPAGSLFVINVDGSEEHQLTPEGVEVACCWGYRWSPDGSRIMFADASGVIWVINPDGTDLTQLFVDAEVQHFRRSAVTPTWSPDGTHIMFALASSPPFAFRATTTSLYVIEAGGTGLTLVIAGGDYKREPTWVP
jgi:Tol biopolymer transport system component